MVFKGPGGFSRIMGIIMNLVLCACFSAYALWVAQNVPANAGQPIFTPLGWFVSFVMSFCVGMTVSELIPSCIWGYRLAGRLGLKGWGAYALAVLVVTFFMVTIMSFLCTWMNNVQRIGMVPVLMSFLSTYPVMFVGGYIIEFIIMKPAMKIAASISGFDGLAALEAGGAAGPMGPVQVPRWAPVVLALKRALVVPVLRMAPVVLRALRAPTDRENRVVPEKPRQR